MFHNAFPLTKCNNVLSAACVVRLTRGNRRISPFLINNSVHERRCTWGCGFTQKRDFKERTKQNGAGYRPTSVQAKALSIALHPRMGHLSCITLKNETVTVFYMGTSCVFKDLSEIVKQIDISHNYKSICGAFTIIIVTYYYMHLNAML